MKLDQYDVGWIFAIRDGKWKEYYKEHYCYDMEPTMGLVGSIISDILDDEHTGIMFKQYKMRTGMTNLIHKREFYTFYEIYFLAFQNWTSSVRRTDLEEWTNGQWKKMINFEGENDKNE